MFKKQFILLLLLISSGTFGFSQTVQRYVFSSSGSDGFGPLSIQSNIGELMIDTYSNSSNFLSQGFVQNDQLSININSIEPMGMQIKAYPNPVISNLTLEINATDQTDLIVEVYDMLGKKQVMQSKSYSSNLKYMMDLNFDSVISGVYFVRVYSAKNLLNEVFKINKS